MAERTYESGDRVRIVTPDFGLINVGKLATVIRQTLGVMVKIDGYAYPIEMYPDDIEPEVLSSSKATGPTEGGSV